MWDCATSQPRRRGDRLELYPWNPITRAEAAHSFAVVLGLVGGVAGQAAAERGTKGLRVAPLNRVCSVNRRPASSWALAAAREALISFSLPTYTAAQREVLHIAVAKIGMPYVWGGTTDNTADGREHGGYDCSGFVWRVYKVSGLPWGRQIRGRTAAEQGGEIPKRERIHLQDVAPGDLLFFGSAHFNSTATESNVIHEAIAMEQRMGDQLFRPGRVRAAAHLRLAGGKLHLGTPGAVGGRPWGIVRAPAGSRLPAGRGRHPCPATGPRWGAGGAPPLSAPRGTVMLRVSASRRHRAPIHQQPRAACRGRGGSGTRTDARAGVPWRPGGDVVVPL